MAALELPRDVVTATLPYVKNWHVKDFAFTRQDGWVGFNLSAARSGEGLLDYDSIAKAVDPATNNINQIVEHWLPWQARRRDDLRDGRPMDATQYQLSKE